MQGQQDYSPHGQDQYPQGGQGNFHEGEGGYTQGQPLDYPQPATLRDGGIASINPEPTVHEVPIHDHRPVGAPVHTVMPPVAAGPGVPVPEGKTHSGTGDTRAPGAKTGAASRGSKAGLALGMLAFIIIAFLVVWEIALVAVASRILHYVRLNGGNLRRLRG